MWQSFCDLFHSQILYEYHAVQPNNAEIQFNFEFADLVPERLPSQTPLKILTGIDI